tara:strand:+ start:262 stop:1059 length:798 start_codon:yes stop_codon:yes gene_type:complete
MNRRSLIDGLYDLKNQNKGVVDVFWSCHKEPTDEIKEKFDHKLFFNGGEEYGAYQQAVEHLKLDDDTICFFLHDDLVLKSFDFIPLCIEGLKNHKVIGNCMNYGENSYDPNKVIEIGIKEEFDNKSRLDYVMDKNKHFFDRGAIPLKTVRPSFVCMKYSSVKEIGGFEPRVEAYDYPRKNEEGTYVYRGNKGMSSWGNEFPQLNNYKFNVAFGQDKITYLSDTYLDSEYIYECARGNVVSDHPITNVTNIMVKDVKTQTFYMKED